jgi:hypothetical protein
LYDGKSSYEKLKTSDYEELKEVPIATIKHFMKSKEKNEQPLIFEGIPHILVADEVDTENAEIIEYKPGNIVSLASVFYNNTISFFNPGFNNSIAIFK